MSQNPYEEWSDDWLLWEVYEKRRDDGYDADEWYDDDDGGEWEDYLAWVAEDDHE